MTVEEEYLLSEYEDLGALGEKKNVRLMRNRIYGDICVQKSVPAELAHIYTFLKENPTSYIPRICGCIADGDRMIILEEYITGRNLEEMVRERFFEETEAAKILRDLCDALRPLHHAHPAIICRDLKAENIMIDKNGDVKIVDFNIARTYQEGQNRDTRLLGTAEYAAPEQYGYFQTDNRTDIYALGVLFNYLTSGKYPVQQITGGKSEHIIKKCISMDPKDRYQSVEELERELRRIYPQLDQRTEDEDEKDRENSVKSFIPPGFRSRTPWKMAVGVLGYLLLTWCCFTMSIEREGAALTGWALHFEQCVIWLSQIACIGVVCDYRGCKRYFPLLNHHSRIVRVVLYVLTDLMLLFLAAVICAARDMFF